MCLLVTSFIHLFDKHKKLQRKWSLLISQKLKTPSLWQLYSINFGLYFPLLYSSQVLSPPDTALSTIFFSHVTLPMLSNVACRIFCESIFIKNVWGKNTQLLFQVHSYPGSFSSTNRWVTDTHHPCHTDLFSQTELHLSQLFLAPGACDIIMNLLPVKHKSNVVWKSRLSRLPSILLNQEGGWLGSGALWRSKMKVLLLVGIWSLLI